MFGLHVGSGSEKIGGLETGSLFFQGFPPTQLLHLLHCAGLGSPLHLFNCAGDLCVLGKRERGLPFWLLTGGFVHLVHRRWGWGRMDLWGVSQDRDRVWGKGSKLDCFVLWHDCDCFAMCFINILFAIHRWVCSTWIPIRVISSSARC